MSKKVLIIIIFVLLGLIITIALFEDYPQKIYNRINPNSEKLYENNPVYNRHMDLYDSYEKEANIVMLGNSITYGVDWNELLNRTDVVNRGISGDITLGMLNRLEHVYSINPKVCFIMGGINDINLGISPEDIVQNLSKIASKLEENDVQPILLSVLHVGESFRLDNSVNKKVSQTNRLIINLCEERSIQYVDLNQSLSKNASLIESYAYDGIHLNASGYEQWKAVINPIINELFPAE